jgi:hypothetical protein
MTIKRGERVLVRVYGNKQIERITWEDTGIGVLLTTEREYQKALQEGTEPVVVGFPKDDIISILEEATTYKRDEKEVL